MAGTESLLGRYGMRPGNNRGRTYLRSDHFLFQKGMVAVCIVSTQLVIKSLRQIKMGQSCTTGIFKKDGREFVFVPGDTVTLGWEQFAVGLNLSLIHISHRQVAHSQSHYLVIGQLRI